ncbi:ATP-binding protein [Candidatus Nanohalobium constans]|uniref:AAA+ superfamily ATPase n=1 Tax=Candidatus Nanohalobium constans TaxID=2565781 RepID=A0A5Q0UFG1_9ARCH|nr:ATP-binding protein [Candidatus Nanohalobium constans]QGA80353.1 AAA+ superfamily ATPase [Candidatus Nanohalobium constans]
MEFYDRKEELRYLQESFEEDDFRFSVIYGRRRVGKTELIKKICEEKPHIYHLFSQDTEKRQIERLSSNIADYFNEPQPKLENWRETVEYIGRKLNEEKIILALDEFPYAIESEKTVPSHFQYLVDELLDDSDSMLILSGSTISIMMNQVLGYESPLYGRRTGQIDLKPFNFQQSIQAIDYSFKEAVKSYTVTGGTPMYLMSFNYNKKLKENLTEKVLNPNSMLFEEPEFLLRQELRNPSRYSSILGSIAEGYNKSNEISNNTGIPSGTISKYLKKLQKLRLITRETPVTASKKTKRSNYKITDNYISFWYRNIYPQKSAIEEKPDKTAEEILANLKHQTAETFEQICRETVQKDTEYSQVGRWWYKEDEIDVTATKDKKILLGEVKWTNQKTGLDLLKKLENKSSKVRWKKGERKVEYALFSKEGFTKNLQQEAENRSDLKTHNLKEIKKIMKAK